MTEGSGGVAWIGVGANLGDARATIESAVAACAALPMTELIGRSSIYRSAPIDSAGDDYLNAALQLRTRLVPLALLSALQEIEQAHGRQRPYRNAPRTLDLDLLAHGDSVVSSEPLTLPHPRAHLRAFVLRPWAELAPDWVIPGHGKVIDLLAGVSDQRIERMT